MQRINSHLHSKKTPPYVINLDPAVHKVPFQSNIDIRDSVNYKEVMKQYKLGPNGGILTSLNLFATKVDQVVDLLERRTKPTDDKPGIKHVLVDTPGQIEVFVWSASGDILLGSLASSFPTVIAYMIDTPRSASTSTFMSNMLYACSILYKTKLPMILVFNKADIKDPSFAKDWMTDFEAFQEALREEEEHGVYGGQEGLFDGDGVSSYANQGSGYMGSLLNSMSLVLDEFYKHLKVVGVSALTGQGIDEFFTAVQEKAQEFEADYRPEMERRRAEREKQKEKLQQKQMGKMMADMAVEDRPSREPETVSEAEDDSDESEDMDGDEGLERRYLRAMENSRSESSGADISLLKYLHSSNIG